MKRNSVLTLFAMVGILGFWSTSVGYARCDAKHIRTNVVTLRDFVLDINKEECMKEISRLIKKGQRPQCSSEIHFSLEPNSKIVKTPVLMPQHRSLLIGSSISWSDDEESYIITLKASGAWSIFQREGGVSFERTFSSYLDDQTNFYMRAEVISRAPIDHELAANN